MYCYIDCNPNAFSNTFHEKVVSFADINGKFYGEF